MNRNLFFIVTTLLAFLLWGCQASRQGGSEKETTLETNAKGEGIPLRISFQKGVNHNHPTMAFWIEELDGTFIQTLYVTQSLATGIFGHGAMGEGRWKDEPGEARRPASLPYWLHKRGFQAPDGLYLPTPENPVADAYTGATPPANFVLHTSTNKPWDNKFRVLMEINQPWDWNNYWHNSRFPDDADYKTSAQPALVYAVTVNPNDSVQSYFLNPIGHSHYSGKNGRLYTDLSSFTTALNIVKEVKVDLLENQSDN